MKLKMGNRIVIILENSVLMQDGPDIKLAFNRPGRMPTENSPSGYAIARYVSPDRAAEVLADVWQAVKAGKDWYELPES